MLAFLKRLLDRRPAMRQRLDVATVSACGLVRPDNQDHFLVDDEHAFFCVADGMGGGEGGALASDIACRCLGDAAGRSSSFLARVQRVSEAIRTANAEIRNHARQAGYRQMATTVTALTIDPTDMTSAVIASVGDSRVYRFRGGALTQLTHDHTLAGELNRRGAMRGYAAGLDARVGSLSHVLTRAVGIEEDVQPDWRSIDVQEDDWYLLCSDGVYDMVSDEALSAAFAAGGSAADMAARLEGRVVAEGATDNYTLVVVRIGGAQ